MNDNTELPASAEAGEVTETNPRLEMVDIDRLVAEAEQRGYLRGRNEQAQAMIDSPAMLENTSLRNEEPSEGAGSSFASRFLSRLPKGVWD